MNQRMFSIYDGPAYQESNAYLDIRKVPVPGCGLAPPNQPAYVCGELDAHRARARASVGQGGAEVLHAERGDRLEAAERLLLPAGVPLDQPVLRGRRHPPLRDRAAVQGRHVTSPTADKSVPGRRRTATGTTRCSSGFTDIDRQTELSDDDGSLTGYAEDRVGQPRPVLQRADRGDRVRVGGDRQDEPVRLRDVRHLPGVRHHRHLLPPMPPEHALPAVLGPPRARTRTATAFRCIGNTRSRTQKSPDVHQDGRARTRTSAAR